MCIRGKIYHVRLDATLLYLPRGKVGLTCIVKLLKLCGYLTLHWALMNTPGVETKISWVQGGHKRGRGKVHGTKIVNMLQLGCNACHFFFGL